MPLHESSERGTPCVGRWKSVDHESLLFETWIKKKKNMTGLTGKLGEEFDGNMLPTSTRSIQIPDHVSRLHASKNNI